MENFKKYLEQFDDDEDYIDGAETLERIGTKIERATKLSVESLQKKVKNLFIAECRNIAAENNISPSVVAEETMASFRDIWDDLGPDEVYSNYGLIYFLIGYLSIYEGDL